MNSVHLIAVMALHGTSHTVPLRIRCTAEQARSLTSATTITVTDRAKKLCL